MKLKKYLVVLSVFLPNKVLANVGEIANPKTYDDIIKYFIILGISIVLLVGYFVYIKKKN